MRQLFALLLLFSLRTGGPPSPRPPNVSLIQLIASPEKFDDKPITVIGFLGMGREASTLWLHKEDAEHVIGSNGVWVEPSRVMRQNATDINLKYVLVVGTFHAFQSGKQGYNLVEGMSGGIADIKFREVWSDPEHPLGRQWEGPERPTKR